jgi:DNA-binding response OmpR family regulator
MGLIMSDHVRGQPTVEGTMNAPPDISPWECCAESESAVVLVVDDQPTMLKYTQRLLEKGGYRVITATDGSEALDVLSAQQVNLILADVVMPLMNGYQLYERVLANPHWASIPFVMVTSRSLDTDVRYGKELGVDDYVTKPFAPQDLLATVRGKLRRARRTAQHSSLKESQAAPTRIHDLGRLSIDRDMRLVRMDGQIVRLSTTEYRLLEYLVNNVNKAVRLQELVAITHDLEADAEEAGTLIRPLIRTVRRKLGYGAGMPSCIESIRGYGYRLIPPNPAPQQGSPPHPLPEESGQRECRLAQDVATRTRTTPRPASRAAPR